MTRAYWIFAMGILLLGVFSNDGNDGEVVSVQELPNVETWDDAPLQEECIHKLDIFAEAERITGCPAEILRGIAGTESHFRTSAVGDNGQSCGMFQLHSRWHDSRVEKYGKFDPFDPADAAIMAGHIVQENLRSFDGDLYLAIAAYQQGVFSVRSRGVLSNYSDRVIFWREDSEKMLSFLTFQGITELGRMENELFSYRSQAAYKSGNSVAVSISRWRIGSFPY
jgi:hypothetical protein